MKILFKFFKTNPQKLTKLSLVYLIEGLEKKNVDLIAIGRARLGDAS